MDFADDQAGFEVAGLDGDSAMGVPENAPPAGLRVLIVVIPTRACMRILISELRIGA